jgi:aryl-alcohol dehydrogenase-like predicted oxidoreductase
LAHVPDPKVPVEETLGAFQKLIDAGKIRYAGCSNYTPEQQAVAFAAGGNGCARYEVIQPHYNLIERNRYEGALEDLCQEYGVGVITYFALAAGFLTGKFRAENDASGTARAGVVSEFLNPRGLKFLDALDTVAARHNATPAQVSLSWIMARPSVTAPIASATSVRQLSDILKSVDLRLTPDDFAILDVDKHLSG